RRRFTEREAAEDEYKADLAKVRDATIRECCKLMQTIVDHAIRDERTFLLEHVLPEGLAQFQDDIREEVMGAVKRGFEQGAGEGRADINALRQAVEALAKVSSATVLTLPPLRSAKSIN